MDESFAQLGEGLLKFLCTEYINVGNVVVGRSGGTSSARLDHIMWSIPFV